MNRALDTIVFEGIAAIRDRLLAMPDPLRLESGDPSFATPDHIKEAARKALADNHTHYAPSTGILPLRQAILAKLSSRNKISSVNSPEQVFVTNGGMHALYCTFQVLLNPGYEVIVPAPNWTPTGWMIRLAGGRTCSVPLDADRQFDWSLEAIAAAINPRTKAILINSPQNPSGGLLSRETIVGLLTLAERHQLYIVADEAYEDLVYDAEQLSVASVAEEFSAELRARVISCFTFSKSYAMTGWRLGYVACCGQQFCDQIKKLILYSINGVSTPTQYAGVAALTGPQDCISEMRAEYRKRRDLIFQGVNATSLLRCAQPPAGAFYLYAQITNQWKGTAWELANLLIGTYGLGCIPGDLFGDSRPSIRFSYACETDMIERALTTLASIESPVQATR